MNIDIGDTYVPDDECDYVCTRHVTDSNWEPHVWWGVLVAMVVMVAWVGGIVTGAWFMDQVLDNDPAICHSSTDELTEATTMVDCEFINGGWYRTEDINP